jgi:hypothetical protein
MSTAIQDRDQIPPEKFASSRHPRRPPFRPRRLSQRQYRLQRQHRFQRQDLRHLEKIHPPTNLPHLKTLSLATDWLPAGFNTDDTAIQ